MKFTTVVCMVGAIYAQDKKEEEKKPEAKTSLP